MDLDNSSTVSVIRTLRNEGIANVSLYPNPAKDRLSINIDADKAIEGHLFITDISGRVLYTRSVKVPQGNTVLPIAIRNFAPGSYIIKIKLNDDIIVKKFNKQ
ncbi:MAG: T9SS type A sorting domain-containing protein [Ferruginibacter sp.]